MRQSVGYTGHATVTHVEAEQCTGACMQVEQWVKDIKLPKEKRSRILTFYRRQAAQPYDEGQLMQQLPFEMRCLVAQVRGTRAASCSLHAGGENTRAAKNTR